jgi:hypothetical protein
MAGDNDLDRTLGIRVLVSDTVSAAQAGAYFLALVGALALIDACGGAASESGWSNRESFETWIVRHLGRNKEDAAQLYDFRNAMLHQSRNVAEKKGDRIGFVIAHHPTAGMSGFSIEDVDGVRIGIETVERFVDEVAAGVRTWLRTEASKDHVQANLRTMLEVRPNGVSFLRAPVIF